MEKLDGHPMQLSSLELTRNFILVGYRVEWMWRARETFARKAQWLTYDACGSVILSIYTVRWPPWADPGTSDGSDGEL